MLRMSRFECHRVLLELYYYSRSDGNDKSHCVRKRDSERDTLFAIIIITYRNSNFARILGFHNDKRRVEPYIVYNTAVQLSLQTN